MSRLRRRREESVALRLPQPLRAALAELHPVAATRRGFLKASGALVLIVGAGPLAATRARSGGEGTNAGCTIGPYPDPDFRQLDTWIVIHPDNTATFFVGKTDGGQGTGTAFRQMMCDELDLAYAQTTLVMGRTDNTPDQGGSGGSDAIERDGWPMRKVAAEARRVLLELAAAHFAVGVGQLRTSEGVITVPTDPAKRVSYAELVGGKRFDVTLIGRNVDAVSGIAAVKPIDQLRLVGQSVPRYDIPAKVDGSLIWAVDMKLPGMLHARHVRPPLAGATLRAVDESSVADLPGLVRVIRRGNYLAVVCEREEQAIAAARKLVATWTPPASDPFPPSDRLFDYLRTAPTTLRHEPEIRGDPDAIFASAKRILTAEYEFPFQGHTAIGPAHALADPTGDQLTIYSNDMKTYGLRTGVAQFLGLPRDRVRVVYMDGPQVYGRTAADDAGFEAAFLAHELGRPVRVQWMRDEETAWDTKGPAYTFKLRGALDASGRLSALEYDACAADHNHLGYNEPDTVLIAQLMGHRPSKIASGRAETPAMIYGIEHQRLSARVVALPLVFETPLRTGNLRDPNGPQVTFAFESFIDELATFAKADPVQFRLDLLARGTEDATFRKARSIAVLRAAAKAYGWEPRTSPRAVRRAGTQRLVGRGVAFTIRAKTIVATIAEVEVDRDTGHVWVKRLVCAHDCGLVINPEGLRRTLECGLLHALSRALYEEVQFDAQKVTSVDWATHPTLRHADTPEAIDIVFVNGDPKPARSDLPPYGAGEAAHKPLIAAVANAIHDATGVRLRRPPFRDERVKAALA